MAEELPFDEPFVLSMAEARAEAEDDALNDHWAEYFELKRRAEEATSLEELAELQTEYQAFKRHMFRAYCRWLASEPELRSWYRGRRRPCLKGCGHAATPGRRKCAACRKAEERSRREAELLRRDELDRLSVGRTELDSLMQLDRAAEQVLGGNNPG